MPTLAETQLLFRHAVIAGDIAGIAPLLVGGLDPEKRLVVHQRNYENSLVTAILGKFPATAWLVGTRFVTQAARRFVREHLPHVPCIAEYGEGFPLFLSACATAGSVPYLGGFAELEWHIGHVAVAADRQPVSLSEFSTISAGALPDTVLVLQLGVRYLKASWPVDELMKLYLTAAAPDRFAFAPAEVWLEVRGARGEFHIDRLDPSEYIFRKGISEGQSLGDAAERALEAGTAFDPGRALVRLVTDGLVTSIAPGAEGAEW